MAVHTLGCKVNQYDTEAVLALFRARGYVVVDFEAPADVYIINTCTVTNVGDKKSRQLIRRAIRRNPDAIVVAMGCYAQVAPEEVAAIPGLDLVVGTEGRSKIVDLVEERGRSRAAGGRGEPAGAPAKVAVKTLTPETSFEEFGTAALVERTRATVKIQEGCAQFCSYCRVPFARGPERSRAPERVVAEVESLVAAGYREIVLTGIHLGSYGRDLGTTDLARMAARVASVPGVYRVRLSSVEPNDVTSDLIEIVASTPNVCRHFHVPLQSGSDAVLSRMRRRYDRASYARVVEMIRDRVPEAGLTTDVIVGFPGESDAEFAETVGFAREMGFTRIHVFPYSRRSGTAAAKFPDQVPERLKAVRVEELSAVGHELALSFHKSLIGSSVEVLVETEDARGSTGLTDTYVRAVARGVKLPSGTVGTTYIDEATADEVLGRWERERLLFGEVGI